MYLKFVLRQTNLAVKGKHSATASTYEGAPAVDRVTGFTDYIAIIVPVDRYNPAKCCPLIPSIFLSMAGKLESMHQPDHDQCALLVSSKPLAVPFYNRQAPEPSVSAQLRYHPDTATSVICH